MDVKIPALITLILTFLIAVINFIKKTPIPTMFIRIILSGLLIFGILVGISFFFKAVLKIDFSEPQDGSSGLGAGAGGESETQFNPSVDYVVSDDEGSDEELDGDVLGEEGGRMLDDLGNEDGGLSGSSTTGDEFGSSEDDGEIEEAEEVGEDVLGSYDDYNSEGEESEAPKVNSEGDTIKEKLGFDASSEDLAKAVKTVLKRDGD